MSFRELSERATNRIVAVLDQEVDAQSRDAIIHAVETAIVDAVVVEHARCTQLATEACGPDQDLAHKISRQIRAASQAVVANLTSMR